MSDSEEFEKWYTESLIKNQRAPTFYEAYMRSKPEIDALKAENERLRKDAEHFAPPYLLGGTRFKMSFNGKGNVTCFANFRENLDGRWVALVDAENDKHLKAGDKK